MRDVPSLTGGSWRGVGWGARLAWAWLLVLFVVGLLAPVIAHGPDAAGKSGLVPWGHAERVAYCGRLPPGSTTNDARGPFTPEASPRAYWLGTDSLGQDVLSNLIHSCRSALEVGLVGAGVALLIGVTLGTLAGYLGGWVDVVVMRVVEIFMAIPLLFLLVMGAHVLPKEPWAIMMLIGAVTWTGIARLTRAEVMRVRSSLFVEAARASGLPELRIMRTAILPSALGPALIESAYLFASAVLFEATLSYLNLAPVDRASWGRMLAFAPGEAGDFAWWLAVFPGLCMMFMVLSCQTLAGERTARGGGGQSSRLQSRAA
ncbi:MAG: ABC transporter permease [Phycisphaerales bacterium]